MRRHPPTRSLSCVGFLACLCLQALSTLHAATLTWSTTPPSAQWSSAANWLGGVAPASGDSLVFGASSRPALSQDIPGLSLVGLTLNSTSPALEIALAQPLAFAPESTLVVQNGGYAARTFSGPGPLRIAPGASVQILNQSAGTLSIQSPVVASAAGSATLTLGGSGPGTVSGSIANGPGTVAVVKSGTGTWTLQGAHTHTGGTTTTAGTLQLLGSLAGTLTVNPGSTALLGTGASASTVVANGNLTVSGTPAATVQSLSGSGQTGVVTVSTDSPATLTLAPGARSFSRFTFTSGTSPKALTVIGTGADVTVSSLGLHGTGNNANWSLTLQGGAWQTTAFSSNSGAPYGTFRLTHGASLRLGSSRFGLHGTWLVDHGTLTWPSGFTNEGAAGPGYRTVVSGSSSVVWQNSLALSSTSSASAVLNSLEVLGGSATIQGNLTLGSTAIDKNETNQLLVSGGKLRINGTLSAAASVSGQTHLVSLTGGTVAVGTFNATHLGGALVNQGATLAPGDVGTFGRLTVTGGLTLSSGTLALDLGSTTAATTGFAASPAYDHLSVSGAVTLGGQLAVFVPRPFFPNAGDAFTLITANSAPSGQFANAPADGTTRIPTADGHGTFRLSKVGHTLVLSDYIDATLPRIVTPPADAQFHLGQTATLSVAASHPAGGALTYQWFHNGVAVPGATGPTLTRPSATLAHDGRYHVVVTNSAGSVPTASVYLHIISPVLLHYRMDQTPAFGAGAITDATGNTSGTLLGSPLPVLGPGATSNTGASYDFSQTNAYLTISSTKAGLRNFGNLTNAVGMTIAFWYKPDVPVTSYYMNGNIARFGRQFWIDWALDPGGTAPQFNFGDGDSAPTLFAAPATRRGLMTDGQWHLFVITLDYRNPLGPDGAFRNNVLPYVDAQVSGGYPVAGPQRFRFQQSFLPDPSDVLSLGAANGRRQNWDNFIIFNYPLNQAEINQLHSTGSLSTHAPQVTATTSTDLLVLPDNSVNLTGEVLNFGQALPVTTTWSVASAPAGGVVTFANPAALNTTATFGMPGTYVLTVTANNTAFSSTYHVKVTVLAEKPLTAFASVEGRPDFDAITGGTLRLQGSSRLFQTPNPSDATYAWSLLSGPAAPTFANPSARDTTATFPLPGTYVLRLAVTAAGVTRTTTVTVRVAHERLTGVVGQAEPQILLWPAATTQLSASVTQTNPARPVTYAWSQIEGPGPATFANASAATTTATFPSPGVYHLRVSAQSTAGSATSSVWVNVWPRGPGNEAGILPPQPRRYHPQPPPFVHPRFLFTAADRPDLLWRSQNVPRAISALARMRADVAASLDQPGHATNEAYARLLARDPTFSSQPLGRLNFHVLLAEAAYLSWLENENHPRLAELGTVFTNALRDEMTWNTSGTSRLRYVGITYDLVYNHLTEEQRDACRAFLGPITARQGVGFQFIDQVYGASMAIYGEPGYDEAAARRNFEALRGAFGDGEYTTPQGWKQEDPAYGGFTGWGINPAAHVYRQFEPLIVTGNVPRENYMEFYLLYPDDKGGIGGHSEGGWAHSGQQYLMHKFFYPEDPLDDFVRNANIRGGKSGDDLFEAVFALPPLSPPSTFASVAATRQKPLSKFDPERGIGVARSDWSADSILLSHDIRRWWGGHIHASVNELNLFAEQRNWFINPGYGRFPNELHTSVFIDGLGSGRNPGRIVDVLDRGDLTAFVGDARHAYTYTGTISARGTTGVATQGLWRDLLFPGSSDGVFPPGTLDPGLADLPVRVNATNGTPTLLNPVQRAFRTSTVVRGPRPYVLVLDDIQKDNQPRDYAWVATVPSTVQARPGATPTDAVLFHQADGNTSGVPQLLVRALDPVGGDEAIRVGDSTYNSETVRRVHLLRRAITPDFRVLLYPHRQGDPAPATTWSGDSLTVSFPGEYTDTFTFDRTPDGRTRIRSFARSLPGRSAPTLTTPTALSAVANPATPAPLTGDPGAAVTFQISAVSDTGATLTPVAQAPSGTTFPAGHNLVYVSATDSLGQTAWRCFPVDVTPGAPAPTVTAVSNFPGSSPLIALRWEGLARATAYSVKRAASPQGPYTVLSDRQIGVTFTDAAPPAGPLFYTVTAWAEDLEGPPSTPLPLVPGLGDFTPHRLGASTVPGGIYRQGHTFLLNDTNGGFSGGTDSGAFAALPWTGDGVFTLRYTTLGSVTAQGSAYTSSGLMIRASADPGAINATATSSFVRLRTTPGSASITSGLGLPALPRPVYLRMQRTGSQLTASASTDGITWQTPSPTLTLDLPVQILVGPYLGGGTSAANLQNARFEELVFLGAPAVTEQAGALRLAWQANAGLTFAIERATHASGPFTSLAAGLTTPAFTDTAVTPGTVYHYRVSARATSEGLVTTSPAVSGFVLVLNPSLPTPTNLVVTPGFTTTTISWTTVPGGAAQVLRRATSPGGPFVEIAVLPGDTTTYTDTRLLTGATYHYTLSTRSGGSESNPSTAASATPIPGPATRLNNALPLSEGAAWSSSVVPTLLDTALWSGTYDTAPATVAIGAGLTVRTLQVGNISRAVSVPAATGPLTLGEGGFDLSAATQNLTVSAPLQLAAAQTWDVASGRTLTLDGGLASTGPARTVTLAGAGTVTLGGTAPITGLRLQRAVAGGSFTYSNTHPAGTVVTLPAGTHAFGALRNASPTGTLVFDATGATVSASQFGSNMATAWTTVLRGGTWTVGNVGANSTGAQIGGTLRLESGAQVTISNGGFGGHGTWLVGGENGPGTLAFNSLSSANGDALGFILRARDGGSITLPAYALAQPDNNITTANEISVFPGGLSHIGGNLTLGNANTGKTETNLLALSGGVLRITGNLSAATTTAGQTRRFEWTGGRLVAASITPSVGFDSPQTTGGLTPTALVVPATGVLAPGDLGTAGRTALNGAYAPLPGAVLDVDLGGTTQATAYQTGQYDLLSITGSATLAGDLRVRLINGFTPTSAQSFTVLTANGGLAGSFANAAPGGRVVLDSLTGSFLVTHTATWVVLSDFQTHTPRQGWRLRHLGRIDATGPAADLADPDGDGVPNLVEYALATTPTSAASVSLPTASVSTLNLNSYLQLTFVRSRTDVTYVVEASATLAPGSWTVIATNPGTVGQNITVTDTVALYPRRFIRLRVTAP